MRNTLLFLLVTGSIALHAQMPVMETNITTPNVESGVDLLQMTGFNGKLYIVSYMGNTGIELWEYDGANPPTLVYDLNPGSNDGLSGSVTANLCVFNNKLYFSGNNGSTGLELYVYDGVNPPTLAADINPSGSSIPAYMRPVGDKIFLRGYTLEEGYEMYIFDGTNQPTLYSIVSGVSSSDPTDYIKLGNKVYFYAEQPAVGRELFVYDPGTNMVSVAADIEPGPISSTPVNTPTVLNNKIYFSAVTTGYGRELHSFDGNVATRVTNVGTGANYGIQGAPVAYNGYVYFAGYHQPGETQLYRYNPVNNTATLVYLVNNSGSGMVSELIVYAGKLYFIADDGQHGREIWVHDGTYTSMLADIDPGPSTSIPSKFTVANDKLYFIASNGVDGWELWSITDSHLAVNNAKLEGEIFVAPNPTTSDAYLNISLSKTNDLRIQVADMTGKLIWEQPTTTFNGGERVTLPLNTLASGTYFYYVKDRMGKTVATGKVVKQ